MPSGNAWFPKTVGTIAHFVVATRHNSNVSSSGTRSVHPKSRGEVLLVTGGHFFPEVLNHRKFGQSKSPGLHRIIGLACLFVLISQQHVGLRELRLRWLSLLLINQVR